VEEERAGARHREEGHGWVGDTTDIRLRGGARKFETHRPPDVALGELAVGRLVQIQTGERGTGRTPGQEIHHGRKDLLPFYIVALI
jgi:hypothetical protein